MTAKPPWERRAVAGALCATAALGLLAILPFAAAFATDQEGFDTPELPLYVAGAILTVPAAIACGLSTRSAFRYAAGRAERGKRVAWLFAAAWVLWFLWGIPVSGGWFAAGLVLYTVLVLPVVLLVLLVSWLVRRRREPAAP